MRHQYTPIFRDLLDSSLWATASAATRCVWITFLLDADPEGCIPTSVPGLARRAGVTVDEARAAIAMLEAPDPDSRTPDHEGRRIEKVPGGWRVLNFVAKRELAKHEAEKARKRRWAAANGKPKPANDTYDASNLDASSETLDAPKPKPKPKPSLSEEGSSPTPPQGGERGTPEPAPVPALASQASPMLDQERLAQWEANTLPVPSASLLRPAVIRTLSEWRPREGELDALRDAARMAGVKDFDGWLKKLGSGPIGGARGVLADKVGDYLHTQFTNWRKWEETDALKDANSRAAAAAPRSFRGEPLPPQGPQRERVPGAPDWVFSEHAQFANKHNLKLGPAARAYAIQQGIAPITGFHPNPADVRGPFMKFLQERAAQKESA